jgi:hypothetical protein
MLISRTARRTEFGPISAPGGNRPMLTNAIAGRYRNLRGLPGVDARVFVGAAATVVQDAVRGARLIHDSRAFRQGGSFAARLRTLSGR